MSRSKPASRPAAVTPPPFCRTRVGTGKDLFHAGVDERSLIARRFREVYFQIVSDIGGDPTEAQAQIARRASALAVWCESAEAELAKGESIDIAQFTTAANSLRRLLADLGLERKATDITSPNLETYLRTRHRNVAAEDEAIA